MGASKTYIGIIMGLATATLVALTFLFRDKIDFINKKKYLFIASIASILVYLLYYYFANIYTIPIFRFFQGIIYAVGFTFGMALAVDIIPPKKRAGWIGLFGISGAITNAFGPFIVEVLGGKNSFPVIFLAAALGSLLWIFSLIGVQVPPKEIKKETKPVALREYKSIIILPILFGSAFSSLFSFISHYAEELNLHPVSWYFFCYAGILISFRLFFQKKLNGWNRYKMIFTAFGFALMALLSASFIHHYTVLWGIAFIGSLYGLAHGVLYPVLNTLFVETTPHRSGKATLMFILLFNLGNTISSFFYGFVADLLGYSGMYLLSAVLLFSGLVIFFKVLDKKELTLKRA